MKRVLFISLVIAFAMMACTSEKQQEQKGIHQMEESLFGAENGFLVPGKAGDMIDAYLAYADRYPDDTLSPEYLFRAADIAMNMGNSALALNLLSRIQKEFPHYQKVAHCLFLQGFIWENSIGNMEKAREIYTRFLALYPADDFADDVALSLKNLGKTPEELIEMFGKEDAGTK
ncbi:MAG: tetratricopeptide repeat protein [Bacteroidia bacterium]|nr:tetratricopeptide repeat protein [Bacteroidales bacterium]MDD3962386.1 tetratricopeptide repeat protein [Bacteroidales bacterium]NCD42449.1 tetratricopeptide repeat protein [Bacteroidia bacterium]